MIRQSRLSGAVSGGGAEELLVAVAEALPGGERLGVPYERAVPLRLGGWPMVGCPPRHAAASVSGAAPEASADACTSDT